MLSRHSVSFLALSLSLLATACDSGGDEQPEVLAELAEADPGIDVDSLPFVDVDAFEALAPAGFAEDQAADGYAPGEAAEHETESACYLGLPSRVFANDATKQATASGQIWGIAQGLYFMDAVRPTFPWLSYWSIDANNTTVAALNQPGGLFFGMDGTPIEVLLQAPSGAVPGGSYDLEVRLYTVSSQLACTDHVTLEIADCGQVGWWATGPWPTPGYDGANCYVDSLPPLPAGSTPFIWNNGWYVTPINGNQCPVGVFDSVNCYIGNAPAGSTAFFYDNNIYYTL